MNGEFKFDTKQINTMRVAGLAAYVQRPPKDRIGWVYACGEWLPHWKPSKWITRVQHFEVTWESFEAAQSNKYGQGAYPWDYLMITSHQMFLTDEIHEIEEFFAQYTDRSEFAQHPDRVQCPHEFDFEEFSRDLPTLWNLKHRSLISTLLRLQTEKRKIHWQNWRENHQGLITKVDRDGFSILCADGVRDCSFDGTPYEIDERQNIRLLWQEPGLRDAVCAEHLPIWDYSLQQWVHLDEVEND